MKTMEVEIMKMNQVEFLKFQSMLKLIKIKKNLLVGA